MVLRFVALLAVITVGIINTQSFSQCTTPTHGSVSQSSNYYLQSVTTQGASQNISNTSSGYNLAGQGYTNYGYNQEVRIAPGNKFQISVNGNNFNMYKRVWVDWNRDGDFSDSGELVTTFSNQRGNVSDSVNVDSSRAGSYVMRIQGRYYFSTPQPCGSYFNGETEDYILTATINNDIAPTGLENERYCHGSQTIRVNLRNLGTNTISSATISGRIGSTNLNTINFSGSLAAGSDTLLNMGSHTFSIGQVDTLEVYTSSPNGGTDSNTVNDTLIIPVRPMMSGTFTIGGTSPDYSNFTSAFNALDNSGLCGNVTFQVRSGTYTETVAIDRYYGSDQYSITVEQDANNSTDPVIRNNSQVLRFRNALNITWDGVDVEMTGNTICVRLEGSSRNITIENSTITGTTPNSTSNSNAVIYDGRGSTDASQNISIINNDIRNGSYGIYFGGSNSTFRDSSWTIRNNTIKDFYYVGVDGQYVDSINVEANVISDKQNYNFARGVNGSYLWDLKFEKNEIRIMDASSPYGAYFIRCDGTAADSNTYINNFIQVEGTSTTNGLYLNQCDYAQVDFNTVRAKGGNTSSYALYSRYGIRSTYRNNNLSATGAGRAIYLFPITSFYVDQADHNNYYSNGLYLGYYGSNATDFNAWQLGVSFDNSSVSADPEFRGQFSSTPNNPALDSAGTSISGIADDINGSTRGSVPDIGCEEFTPSSNDLSILKVFNTSICPGNTTVQVRVKNAGSNTINSASIDWWVRVNNASPTQQNLVSFTNMNLASRADTVLNLNNFNFIATNYYKVKAWVTGVNGGADNYNSADTASSDSLLPGMNGTYTIGGTSPDYSNVGAALNDLNARGVCGPVIFNIRPGTYSGSNTYRDVRGASTSNTITFRPDPNQSGQVIFRNSYYPIYINGGNHFIFRDLTMELSGANRVVWWNGPSKGVKFIGNTFTGSTATSTTTSYAIFYLGASSNNPIEDFEIRDNIFSNGSYGIYASGSSSSVAGNAQISGNSFSNYTAAAIYARYFDDLEFSKNTAEDRGQYNFIYHLDFQYCDFLKVDANDIQAKNGYGMRFLTCNGAAGDSVIVSNNFVSYSQLATGNYTGMYFQNGSYQAVHHNSVHFRGNNLTGSEAVFFNGGSLRTVYNNIFMNSAGGYAIWSSNYAGITRSDHNNYYSNGNYLGYLGGSRTNLTQWRIATNDDQNSLSVDPSFVSNTDLHVQNNQLDNAGKPLPSISTDIDGDQRSATAPDIGADEFAIYQLDAQLASVSNSSVCPGNSSARITLRNAGLDTLTSVSIGWAVATNNGAFQNQSNANFSGSLAFGASSSVTLGTFNFVDTNQYQVRAWVLNANGVVDSNQTNDTASTDLLRPAMSGTYTVGGASPDFATLNDAINSLDTLGICSDVTFYVRPGTYNGRVSLINYDGGGPNQRVRILGDTNAAQMPEFVHSNWTFELNSASWYDIENLKIRTTGYNPTIYFYTGKNEQIRFIGDSLIARSITSSSTYYSPIYKGSNVDMENISFEDNVIIYGWNSVYINRTGNETAFNIDFVDNEILEFRSDALNMNYVDSLSIESNYFESEALRYADVIYLNRCAYFDIEQNEIYMPGGGRGIYMNYCASSASRPATIINNMIYFSNSGFGIFQNRSDYVNIYHNSINFYSGSVSSYPFYSYFGSYINNQNNNYVNSAGGYALYWYTFGNSVSDYNNYYSPNNSSNFLRYSGTNYTSLSAYTSAVNQEANSVSADPNFFANDDLHCNSAILDSINNPVGVLVDHDGDSRSSTHPDIGADEFVAVDEDAAIVELISDPCPGNSDIQLRIKNFGAQTLTSTRVVWSVAVGTGSPVNQTPFVLNTIMATGEDTVVSIGTFNFSAGFNYSFVFRIDSVNGLADGNSLNDTLIENNLVPSFSGTYTVGGNNPNYSDLTSLLSDLRAEGLCGPTTVMIRPGTYAEQLSINGISGTSAINTLSFIRDTSLSGTVVIRSNTNSLYLSDVQHVRVEGLSFEITSNAAVAYLNGDITGLRLINNDFEGAVISSNSYFYSVLYRTNSTSSASRDILLESNRFSNGSQSIDWNLSFNRRDRKLRFIDNEMKDFVYYGIDLSYADSVTFNGNRIVDSSMYRGLSFVFINDYEINENYFDLRSIISSGNGVYISQSDGTSSNPARLYNNSVRAGVFGGSVTSGVYINRCDNLGIYYNSFNVTGNNSAANTLLLNLGSGLDVRNNNIVNSGGGYAYFRNSLSQTTQSDYNNIYSTGNIIGYYNGIRQNLSQWRSATGRDQNSISADPIFVSDTDLHAYGVDLDGNATPITGISIDFDGETRNSSTPDIGMDEFTPLPLNAALTALEPQLCPGTNNVSLSFRNFGSNTINYARFQWQLSTNGGSFVAQPAYTYTGSLTSGADATVNLGNLSYSSSDYYEIRVYVDSVNNGMDQDNSNDTIQLSPQFPAMSGTFTIGGNNPDFFTIGEADTALDTRGVCGSVTFRIRPGTFNETIEFGGYIGASASNTVTFVADSGLGTVLWSNSGHVIVLEDANYLSFEDLHLKSSGATVVTMRGINEYITFEHNRIEAALNNSTAHNNSVIFEESANNNELQYSRFEDNEISGGSVGINLLGSSSIIEAGNEIINNEIYDFGWIGINLQYQDSLLVNENEVYNDQSTGDIGIQLNTCDHIELVSNELMIDHDFARGMAIINCDASASNRNLVANNMVSVNVGSVSGEGIYTRNSSYTDFIHNSVLVNGNNTGCQAFYAFSGTNLRMRNNSFSNEAGGYAFDIRNFGVGFNSDYNNFYSTGSNIARINAPHASISSWNASSGQDANSVSADPFYLSSNDLHALSADLDASAFPFALVTADIDGDQRSSTTPDIGADEFTLLNNDAGIIAIDEAFFCPGTNAINVDLRNFGANTLSNVGLRWEVLKNGTPVGNATYNWSGTLTTGAVAQSVNIGSFTFNPDTNYQVNVWVTSANSVTDPNTLNDTLRSINRMTALNGVYTVGGFGADFPSISTASNALNSRGVCGATRFLIQQGTYYDRINLNQVEGVSAVNTIEFSADSSNTAIAEVISNNNAVRINATDHVTIQGLVLRSNIGSVVALMNGVSHARIENNEIHGPSNYSSGDAGIYFSPSGIIGQDSNRIQNNQIRGGAYGIYSDNSAFTNHGNIISENGISDYQWRGIYLRAEDGVQILRNEIIDTSMSRGNGCLYLLSSDGVHISRNRMLNYASGSSISVLLNDVRGSATQRNSMINNEISTSMTAANNFSATRGLSIIQSSFVDLYFNSVFSESGSSTGRALDINSSNNIRSQNNVFSSDQGYAVYMFSNSSFQTSNYNAYYSGGPNLAYGFGVRSDLSAWRSVTNQDQNSVEANPNFISSRELFPNNIALDSTGISIVGINLDIDGNTRNAIPDMGAYQFDTRQNDAGVIALSPNKVCTGNSDVIVSLKNFGGDTLTSATISWSISVNGSAPVAQTGYNWTGNLITGTSDPSVNLGTYNFSADSSYLISAYALNPNGQNDELNSNDTLSGQSMFVSLNGTYTVGDSTANFPGIPQLQSALDNAGVCGPVTIKFKPGNYQARLILDDVEGHSLTNPIRITSDTGGVALLHDSLSVIHVKDMSSVRIDHLDLESDANQPTIRLSGMNEDIQIDSNRIIAPLSFGSNSTEAAIYESGSISDQFKTLRIENNVIERGSYAISLQGANQYYKDEDLVILGNEIGDFTSQGLFLSNLDSVHVKANLISASYDASNPRGVHANYLSRFQLLSNEIQNQELGGNALYLNRCSGSSNDTAKIYNNFIQAGGNALGIQINYSDRVNFYHNSVNITADSLGNTGDLLRVFSSSNVDIKNNNLVNASGGLIYAGTSYPFSADFNNVYTTGVEVADNIADLAAWVNSITKDGNSVSVDPFYLSETDLHANQTLLDSAALALNFIGDDIDGDQRDINFPDIGADEFDLIENVGLVDVIDPVTLVGRRYTSTGFDTAQQLRVIVRNFGPSVSGIPVFYEYNGQSGSDTIHTSLAQGAIDTLNFSSTISMDSIGVHELLVYHALATDQDTDNDTIRLQFRLIENEPVLLPVFQDFEQSPDTNLLSNAMGIKGAEKFDFETRRGKLQTAGFTVSGSRSIIMASKRFGRDESNFLLYTLNLSEYDLQDSLYLSFDYEDLGEERDRDDRVWVRGSDSDSWIEIYNLWRNRQRRRVKSVSQLDITSELAAANQQYSASFQIRFGQEDNEPAPFDGWSFDNILLDIQHPVDLIISEARVDYHQVPLEHNWNSLNARVINAGYDNADSVRFKYSSGVISDSVIIGTMSSGAIQDLSTGAELGASSFGLHRISKEAITSDIDGDRRNDTVSQLIQITDTILAREDGSVDSTFGFVNSSGEMAQLFEINQLDSITGVSLYLNSPPLNDSIRVKVYEENSGVPGNEIASSAPFVFQSNAARWYDINFECLQTIDSGKFFVAVEQMNKNELTLGMSYFNYRDEVAVFRSSNGNWQSLTSVGLEAIYSLRPIFGHYNLPSLNVVSGVCEGAAPVSFSANPGGGVFTGPGMVNDSVFDPANLGLGSYNIKYVVARPNGCVDTNGFEISVDSLTPLSFINPVDICSNEAPINLNTASPAGGVYSGLGVSGSQFDPAVSGAGSFDIYYEFSNLNQCVSRDTAQIAVLQAPVANLSPLPSLCEGDSAIALNQGSPAGGVYSGQGVSAGNFDPAGLGVGTFEIAYAVTDPNSCVDTAFGNLVIDTIPIVDLGPDIDICGKQTDTLKVTNSPATYDWSTGESSQSIIVNYSDTISLIVTDNNGCSGTDTVIVNYEAVCVGIDEAMSSVKVNYYPNPNNGQFELRIEGVSGKSSLQIRDVQGRVIAAYNWSHTSNNWTEPLNLSKQAAGVYMLELETEKGRSVHRVTIR